MLGLVKNFAKAMNHRDKGFKHVRKLFPSQTKAKLKQLFVAPEIRKVRKDKDFKTKLSPNELSASNAFALVVQTSWEITQQQITTKMLTKCCYSTKKWMLEYY